MENWAIHNFKGGVAKTTTAANLGAGLALRGSRVALVDGDYQRSLSRAFLHKGKSPTIRDLLLDDTLKPTLFPTAVPNLFLIPGSADMNSLDYDIEERLRERARTDPAFDILDPATSLVGLRGAYLFPRLTRITALLAAHGFDYVLWDLPAQANCFVTLSLVLCDRLLIPVQCELLAVEALEQAMEMLDDLDEGQRSKARILRTMVTAGYRHQAAQSLEIEKYGALTMKTVIKRQTIANEGTAEGIPVIALYPGSDLARAYNSAIDELLGADQALGGVSLAATTES